jgi:hypothetical protein
LGGKYLFLNGLRVERTALDKQLGSANVLPQRNFFFSVSWRFKAFIRMQRAYAEQVSSILERYSPNGVHS